MPKTNNQANSYFTNPSLSYAAKTAKNLDLINRFNFNEVNLIKLITKITTKLIEEQLQQLANKVMDVFINAINQTISYIETEHSSVIDLFKKTLEQNLFGKSKKELVAMAKEYASTIDDNENDFSPSKSSIQKNQKSK